MRERYGLRLLDAHSLKYAVESEIAGTRRTSRKIAGLARHLQLVIIMTAAFVAANEGVVTSPCDGVLTLKIATIFVAERAHKHPRKQTPTRTQVSRT